MNETPEQSTQRIFGERASLYTTSPVHTDRQNLNRIVELAELPPGGRVLDVATGTGHLALSLSPVVGRVVGCDLTREMLFEGQKLLRERGVDNVRFIRADSHRLPFSPGAFDVVTCRRACHHFSRVRDALREMKRVLVPGGRLVIDDRSIPEDDFVDQCMNELDTYHDRSHVRQYRPSEWRTMLQELGLRVNVVELYMRHRSLAALTDGICEEDVRAIHRVLSRLSRGEREKLGLREVNDELHIYHWFLVISATRD